MPRKAAKHKTKYEKTLDKYRASSGRHVVTFEADMDEDAKRHAFSIADDIRQAGNEVTAEINKRYRQLLRTKKYRALKKDYAWHAEHLKNLDPEGERYKKLDTERKEIGIQMSDMQKEFGITWDDTRKFMETVYPKYRINSIFALKKAEAIWQGMEKLLYGPGKRLHFKKRGDMPAIQAKQINRGIPLHLDENNQIILFLDGVGEFGLLPVENDIFLKEELQKITDYLKDPSQEEYFVCHYMQTKELIPVFRPCYVSLVCKTIRKRLRVYVQITVAASPFMKKKKNGSPRHHLGKGRVGVDLGTQSCAVSSDNKTELFNLAERNHKCTKEYERRKKFLLRKMNASQRAMNPERYNEDGTYKKGSRGKWRKSNHYKKMAYELHELERRNADSRKYATREDANRIRSYGDICIIEPPNASKLQKKAKKTERQEKTSEIIQKDGSVKTIHKYKKKKRFGKSILHRCPGLFQAELKNKFGSGYHEVSTRYRASQYDHEKDDYHKKKLSERWHFLSEDTKIQRDSYSSFLLRCADKDFKTVDRKKCMEKFPAFYKMHQNMITMIKKNKIDICNSGIKV